MNPLLEPQAEHAHTVPPDGSATLDEHRLWEIAAHLFSAVDEPALLQQVVEAGRLLSGAHAATILLFDPGQALFVPAIPSVAIGLDERWLQRHGLEAAQALARRAMETGDVIELLDAASESGLEHPLLAGGIRPGAVCVVPLTSDGAIVGVLEVYDARPRAAGFGVQQLRAFATLAGAAVANARARHRERILRERLEALDQASTAIAAELSLNQVLQRIVEIATSMAGARYGALGIIGPDDYLTDFITTGITAEERQRMGPLPRGHGLLGVLIRQGEALRVPNIGNDPRRVGFPPGHPPMTSLLGVPIRVRDTVVGDLYLTDKVGAAEFSEEDQHMVELLAGHAGVAIENARLYAREQEARHALQRAMESLRENERRFRGIFEQSFQFLALLALDGTLIEANQQALRPFGLGLADVSGRPLWETYWWTRVSEPHAHERLMAAIAEAAQGHLVRYEVEMKSEDSTAITLDFSIKPILDDAGRAIQLIAEGRDVTASRALARARDELALLQERERISRDLHDGIIQDIYAGTLQLESIGEDLQDQAVQARVLEVADHFSGVIGDVRTYIQGLRARQLEGRLLSDGIGTLVHEANGRSGVGAAFVLDGKPYRLPDVQANTLLQLVREGLSNVVKHAQARQVEVHLAYEQERVVLTITDDGQGFDPAVEYDEEHHGLRNLQSRMTEAGGQLTLESATGVGTRLTAVIPAQH